MGFQDEDVPCGQQHCAISIDEMKIKAGLVFSKHTGIMVGFIDLGNCNRYMELFLCEKVQSTPAELEQLTDQQLAS